MLLANLSFIKNLKGSARKLASCYIQQCRLKQFTSLSNTESQAASSFHFEHYNPWANVHFDVVT